MFNNNVIKSDLDSTDTHGYSEIIFADTHLLGVTFAPRIKKIGAQKIYTLKPRSEYTKKPYKILPNHRINYCIVWKYWDDSAPRAQRRLQKAISEN